MTALILGFTGLDDELIEDFTSNNDVHEGKWLPPPMRLQSLFPFNYANCSSNFMQRS